MHAPYKIRFQRALVKQCRRHCHMRRAPPGLPALQFLAALTADMSSRPSYYRGGRRPFGRTYSGRPYGESNFRPVHDANSVHHEARPQPFDQNQSQNQRFYQQVPPPLGQYQSQNQRFYQQVPPPLDQYQSQNQRFYQQVPPPIDQYQSQNQRFYRQVPPPFYQNQNRTSQPAQQFRPRQQKPLDYREWEYAKTAPPRDSEKFTILSYNILADYLAINHRSKLYFHIPRHILEWGWRKRKIIFELGLWSADILCLQEVDRFGELAEELKKMGYDGIWKMRTGTAVDGCAIFWRPSRFKLVYEESIQYNNLGLRDNVAQICVLEKLMRQNNTPTMSAVPMSSRGSNKVVVCNIHVLYNPKRGDIKLGQVRNLLDRAHAVSKVWDDAPVVLCGDFNSTPKSPLYNFISEQKLDLSGIDRDKVSGQASDELRAPGPYNSARPTPSLRTQSSESSIQAPVVVDNNLGDSISSTQIQDNVDNCAANVPSINNNPKLECTRTEMNVSNLSSPVVQCGSGDATSCTKETKETQVDVVDSCKSGIGSHVSVLADGSLESLPVFQSEDEFPVDETGGGIHKSTTLLTSHHEDACPSGNDTEHGEKLNSASIASQRLLCEHSHSSIYEEDLRKSFDNLEPSPKASPSKNSGSLSSQPIVSGESIDLSTPCQTNDLRASRNIYNLAEKQFGDASHLELRSSDDRIEGEDESTFLSALQGMTDTSKDDFDCSSKEFSSDPDHFQSLIAPQKTSYDPSLWTPIEIETATGNADCMVLEHPLKLKSAYAEVEGCSGTRDPNGEPIVTSYHRCFLGTVDYIWCSEGLQPVRVLAPMPKHAMQWTPGFPTKKWGSDHIALASELAFTKEGTSNDVKVQ